MAKRFTDFELQSTVELVHAALRSGARPPGQTGLGRNALEVAAQDGLSVDAIRRRIQEAERRGMLVDWTLYRPHQYQKPPEVAKITPVHVPATHLRPSGKVVKVCVIPDIHISPDLPHTRMLWIGRWIAEMAPDYTVQLGDWLTLDSLSSHAKPGTIEKMVAPALRQDIMSAEESLQTLKQGLGMSAAPDKFIFLKGNHEYRAERFENSLPELQGTIVSSIERPFVEAGWRIIPFAEYFFIEGVGFIHHVMNTIGRPYGGKTATQRVASDSVFSTVSGHTHQRHSTSVPKIGPNHAVRAISAGCALPAQHVEHYAKHSTTGWDYGVMLLTICEGQILDEMWFSMNTLEERYG